MGNISQSSKRSALKGFDVYFQHEKKMNNKKEGFIELWKEDNISISINYQTKTIAHDFGLVDYYQLIDCLRYKLWKNNGRETLLTHINEKVVDYLLKNKIEYLEREFPNITKGLK